MELSYRPGWSLRGNTRDVSSILATMDDESSDSLMYVSQERSSSTETMVDGVDITYDRVDLLTSTLYYYFFVLFVVRRSCM